MNLARSLRNWGVKAPAAADAPNTTQTKGLKEFVYIKRYTCTTNRKYILDLDYFYTMAQVRLNITFTRYIFFSNRNCIKINDCIHNFRTVTLALRDDLLP